MSSNIKRRLRALGPSQQDGPQTFSHIFIVPLQDEHDISPPSDPRFGCIVPGIISGSISSAPGESYDAFKERMQKEYPADAAQ